MSFDELFDWLEGQDVSVFRNVRFEKEIVPILAVHESGLYVFLKKEQSEPLLYSVQKFFSVSRGKMRIYRFNEESDSWSYENPFTGEIESVDDIKSHVWNNLNGGVSNLEEARVSYFIDKLNFGTKTGSDNHENVKTGSDGRLYVKRAGHWCPASSDDQDEAFKKTLLFGVFGWYQFHIGKKFSGVLYILTCGLFGIGYIFDVLAFLVGTAKDSDGYYYLPLSDRKKGFLLFLISVGAAFGLLFIYVHAAAWINGSIAGSQAVQNAAKSKVR